MRLYKSCPFCRSVQVRRRRKNRDYVCDLCHNHFRTPKILGSWG